MTLTEASLVDRRGGPAAEGRGSEVFCTNVSWDDGFDGCLRGCKWDVEGALGLPERVVGISDGCQDAANWAS